MLKALLKGIFQLLLVPVTMWLAAGTLAWFAGWVFLVLFYGFLLVLTLQTAIRNPGLLKERLSLTKPNQEGWDK
ncbi:MAG TPA: hypothetical protein VFN23_11730, partial [Ktedonobacteraceae bacterium]|nr:hypothetical protein [Ktedonobacteraceae bacterium]